MKTARKMVILVAVLLAFGASRLHFEQTLHDDFREVGLIREAIDIDTRDRIDQTSFAVALGGLRTLVATILHLQAHGHFSNQRWDDLEKAYSLIVDFAPNTRYYWEFGSWHLSYNAAAYYLHDSVKPAMRRHELWRSSIHRGRAFLERGIRNNPNDWSLHRSYASLLRDPNKLLAFRDRDQCLLDAAKAYQMAIALGGNQPMQMARFQLYCLARVPGHEQDSLNLARSLYADPRHHRPTLQILLYVLECHADPERDVEKLALEIFGNAQTAYKALVLHWQRTREGYPNHGVAEGIVRLERSLGIPMMQSVLSKPLPPAPSLDDWFKK